MRQRIQYKDTILALVSLLTGGVKFREMWGTSVRVVGTQRFGILLWLRSRHVLAFKFFQYVSY